MEKELAAKERERQQALDAAARKASADAASGSQVSKKSGARCASNDLKNGVR